MGKILIIPKIAIHHDNCIESLFIGTSNIYCLHENIRRACVTIRNLVGV